MSKGKKTHSKNARKIKNAKARVTHTHVKMQSRKMSPMMKALRATARKESKLKAQKLAQIQMEKEAQIRGENERIRVETLLENVVFADFISKNVGKRAINIIKLLHEPQTDEKLAGDLSVKINEVRRILNVLDSYGVARYDTNKDSKGWLTFMWYLDSEKLSELHTDIINRKPESAYKLQEDCNDFFYCAKCYEEQQVILPFDTAFEAGFKCENCGKQLKQLNKTEASALFDEKVSENATVAEA